VTSAQVALLQRDEMKDLKPFLLKRVSFFIDMKVKRKAYINHPGREMNIVKIR
jgi:hypothetical protein